MSDGTAWTASGSDNITYTFNVGNDFPELTYFGEPKTALEWLDRRINEIRVKL